MLVRELARRAELIRQKRGASGLAKGAFWFLLYPFYKSTRYYLYANTILPEDIKSETYPGVDEGKLSFIVISSNQEADRLEAEGFSFRKYPTNHNQYLKLYTRWLDLGAIAFCTFVGNEFAAITWVIPSEKVQRDVKAPPLKLDYSNQVTVRGVWTNPRFRGKGLHRYSKNNLHKYLASKGITSSIGTVDYSNKTGAGLVSAMGGRQVGTARALRILWFKFWKESYNK